MYYWFETNWGMQAMMQTTNNLSSQVLVSMPAEIRKLATYPKEAIVKVDQ